MLATTENHGGRDIVTITTSDDESVTKRYVFPDAGLAVELAVTTAVGSSGEAAADAIADTVTSC